MMKMRWCMAAVAAFGASLAVAQGAKDLSGADPTRMSAAMGDVIKAQLAEFRSLEIKGLVSATGTGGVAIVSAKGDSAFRVARRGSTLPLSASGVPFPVKVTDVTDNGVEVSAETLDARWTIPVSFAREGRASQAPTGTLAYVEFEGLSLKTALRLLADQSGRNFVWTEKSANVPVSLFLRDTTVEMVIDELCKSHRLWYRKSGDGGVMRIVTMEEFKESLTGYQQEEVIETFTLLYPNVTEVASIIQGIYADRARLTLEDEDVMDDELTDLGRRFEKFQAISDTGSSSDLMGNFSSVNSMRSSVASGGRGGRYSSRGGLWFNDGASRLAAEERRNERRIEDFKVRDAERIQSMLNGNATNATIAAALAENKYQPPSVYITIARRSNMLVVRTGDPRIMEEIRKLVQKVDVPTPMVYLEVEIMSLELEDGLNSVFDWDIRDVAWNNGRYGVEIDGSTAFSPEAPGKITFNVVSKHVENHIRLQRERGKLKSIATPSLLTAHNEVSQFFMGEEVPIVRNITATIVAGGEYGGRNIVVPQTEMEWRKVGTRLLITPNINVDRTVTLRLMQETSVKKEDGGTIVASVVDDASQAASVQKFKVDTIEARSIAGAFVAQDGMAVVAGGMIEEKEEDSASGIPVLMDLPWLGWLFRSTEKVKTRRELVIYLKPHVLSTPGEGRRVTERVNADKVRNPLADQYRSADDRARQLKDRREAEIKQKKPSVLPDVDTFHIK